MGKNRDKQRTKGNLKPSSSGRAAALVTRDGALGFVGFDGQGSANLGYVPMTTSAGDEVDNSVDADFRMVMRKLTKRDALTKYKALQEFSELCKNSKSDVVEGVLPFWPRLYNKLAMDTDHRVREGTQEAMLQLVQRVGRNLAPHLKSVMGVWLCAQFDSYATVASTAQRAFQAAFSEAKQNEALMFCRLGLCEFLEDNILRQSAETLSDTKIVSKEDRDSKYNRVVSSSLLALGYLISVSSTEINSEMKERYQEIFEEKKLWKFARHTSPLVRSAIFSLVITSCLKIPSVVQIVSSQVCPVVLSSLNESEPAVCQNLWGAVLFILRTIPDCWEHVNVRKAVLPKLWSVLKNGGYGCASVIYPSLLPFLSKIPTQVIGQGVGFYREFFDNLQEGLKDPKVISSQSESAVVMTTYMECLQYCLVHPVSQNGNAMSIREYLIKDQLLPMLKMSLDPVTKLPTMQLYLAVGNLLNYMTSGSVNKTSTMETIAMVTSENPDDNDAFASEERSILEADIILGWFWQGFNFLCLSILQDNSEEKLDVAIADSMAHCLLSLKSPSILTKRQKKNKVAFDTTSTDSTNEPTETKTEVKPNVNSCTKIKDLYNGQLLELVTNICSLCLKQVKDKKQTSIYLRILSTLFPSFVSVKLLQVLLSKLDDNVSSLHELCEEFLGTVVYPLFTEFGDQSKDSISVINMLFGVLSSYSLEEQEQGLNKVTELNNSTDFLFALLQKGIQESFPGITAWLSSQSGSERIQKLLRVATLEEDDNSSLWGILHLCLCSDKKGPLVNHVCIDIILESFSEMFRRKKIIGLGRILKILQDYFDLCKSQTDDLSSATEDILLALFLMQFSQPQFQDEVLVVWQAGVQAFNARYSGCDVLLVRTSAIIMERLKCADSIDSILSVTSAAVRLIQDTNDLGNQDDDLMTCTRKLYHSFVPDVRKCTEWRDQSPKGNCLNSHLCATIPVISDTPEAIEVQDNVKVHHNSILFAAMVTKSLLTMVDGFLSNKVVVEGHMLVRVYMEACWVNVWCLCVLGDKGSNWNKNKLPSHFTQTLPNTHKLLEIISPTVQDLMEYLDKNQLLQTLLNEALTMAKANGFLWTLVLDMVIIQLKKKEFAVDQDVMLADLQDSLSVGETSFLEALEKSESVLQTIITVVPHVDNIYDVKVLTENHSKLMTQQLRTQEFACVFSVLATCLEKWLQLTDRREEAMVEYQMTLNEILEELMEWKNSYDKILLLNANMNDATMAEVSVNTAIMRIIELAVKDAAKLISSNQWDFILCGLAGWLQTCEENLLSENTSLLTTRLCHQTCHLHSTVSLFFETFPEQPSEKEIKDQPEEMKTEGDCMISEGEFPPNLLTEWREFFSVNVYSTVLSMFLQIADKCRDGSCHVTIPFFRTCENLGQAVTNTPINILQEYKYTKSADSSDGDDTLPQWAQDLLLSLLPLLECDTHSIQIAAYRLLSKIMPILPSCHTNETSSEDEENEIERSPPSQLMNTINNSVILMDIIMQDASVPFGGQLCLATDVEAQRISLTLFMSCRLLILFFKNTIFEKRSEYAVFLRRTKLIDNLMSILYRLMPQDSRAVVTEDFQLSVDDCVTESLVQDLGRCVYYGVLHWMPAMVRKWFNGLEKKHATIVDRYTSSSVTPLLCQREMEQVKSSSIQFTNMQVKTRPVAGEVAAVYTVDEISMELVVKLANNHPLGVVTVDSGKKVGVTNSQWRSWILQMTTFLTHQNGSIMDGLILWKRNADKHFEGVDDCMICFSIIHVSNYSLPKLSCKTCKKKFHSICLYRWFSTSNNSTCPLCRNIF